MERLMRTGLYVPCGGAAGTVNGFAEDGAAARGRTHILLPGPLYPQPLDFGTSLVSTQLGVLGRLLGHPGLGKMQVLEVGADVWGKFWAQLGMQALLRCAGTR